MPWLGVSVFLPFHSYGYGHTSPGTLTQTSINKHPHMHMYTRGVFLHRDVASLSCLHIRDFIRFRLFHCYSLGNNHHRFFIHLPFYSFWLFHFATPTTTKSIYKLWGLRINWHSCFSRSINKEKTNISEEGPDASLVTAPSKLSVKGQTSHWMSDIDVISGWRECWDGRGTGGGFPLGLNTDHGLCGRNGTTSPRSRLDQ